MATPMVQRFTIRRVTEKSKTPNGNHFVACDTSLGVVAFWGEVGKMKNVDLIASLRLPAEVIVGTVPSNMPSHKLWVPHGEPVFLRQT